MSEEPEDRRPFEEGDVVALWQDVWSPLEVVARYPEGLVEDEEDAYLLFDSHEDHEFCVKDSEIAGRVYFEPMRRRR